MGRARGHHHAVAAAGGHLTGDTGAQRRNGERGRPWTDDSLHAALAAFLDGRDRWPTQREFQEGGRSDLYMAVKRRGGVLRWSERLGLPVKPGQDRGRPYTNDDAVREAAALQAEYGFVPGPELLRELGHHRLATLIRSQYRNTEDFAGSNGLASNPTRRMTLPGRDRVKSYIRTPDTPTAG